MPDPTDPLLARILRPLAEVGGVAGIVLGGSRARGTAGPGSDHDIGLYFRSGRPLDTDALLRTVRGLVDDPDAADVTPIGGWGPRIVGGGWLTVRERKVDLIYRCIEAVESVIVDCREGRVSMDYQPGHPHGFSSAIWMGEVALCQPLHDPDGTIAGLKTRVWPYPDRLRAALLRLFSWEVGFAIRNAETAAARGDQTHVAGCAYRALCCVAQVLFALNRRYLINEKGALAEAAGFPLTLPGLSAATAGVWLLIGRSAFAAALDKLRRLDRELQALVVSA